MRAMKDSGIAWIGKIPQSWTIDKIKHHFAVISGATPKSEITAYWDGDIPWVTPADYKTQDKYVSQGKKSLTQEGYDACGTTLVPAGSLIFSKRAPVGTVAIAKNKLCTNQGCLSCVAKDAVNPDYYYYVLSTFTEQFDLVSTGTTFKEIAADVFANFYLPRPDYTEQGIIASFLNSECARIDAVMEQTRTSIEEYKKLKQAVITHAVTKGIHPNRPMKDSGVDWIGEIPTEWRTIRIKYIGQVKTGPFGTQLSADEYIDHGTPIINVKNIGAGIIKEEDLDTIPDDVVNRLNEHLLKTNDIVFARKGSIDKHAIIRRANEGWIQGSDCIRLRIEKEVLPQYLNYYLESIIIKGYLQLISNGATMPSLNSDMIENILIILPSTNEQKEVCEYLGNITEQWDRIIEKKECLLTELESYKKSLIYEYVTGKKEVAP